MLKLKHSFFLPILFAPLIATAIPIPVIFDTDMEMDCDDAGALAMLHNFANNGEVSILATTVCTKEPNAAPCVDAINTFYGRPNIPIGVTKGTGAVVYGSKYTHIIAAEYPRDMSSNPLQQPDAVAVYRQVLSAQPNASVVVISVGYLTNLRNLLQSGPDGFSSLNGRDLVALKVKKWVCMGSNFPNQALDWNFSHDGPATKYAVDNWPTWAVFSGENIGQTVMTGAQVRSLLPTTHVLRRVYDLWLGATAERPSWDQTAVLYAVRGLSNYWTINNTGSGVVQTNGSSSWVSSPDKNQSYLIKLMDVNQLDDIIEQMMIGVWAPSPKKCDMNGDGREDILWFNPTTAANRVWMMNGTTYSSTVNLNSVSANWRMIDGADFNSDGKTDILWRNAVTGANTVWLMNGTTLTSGVSLLSLTDLNWKMIGAGDFNADGKADILWRNYSTSANTVWMMNGTTHTTSVALSPTADLNWKMIRTGDFNSDGKSDILWRHATTGANTVWLMNGTTVSSGVSLNALTDLNWKMASGQGNN